MNEKYSETTSLSNFIWMVNMEMFENIDKFSKQTNFYEKILHEFLFDVERADLTVKRDFILNFPDYYMKFSGDYSLVLDNTLENIVSDVVSHYSDEMVKFWLHIIENECALYMHKLYVDNYDLFENDIRKKFIKVFVNDYWWTHQDGYLGLVNDVFAEVMKHIEEFENYCSEETVININDMREIGYVAVYDDVVFGVGVNEFEAYQDARKNMIEEGLISDYEKNDYDCLTEVMKLCDVYKTDVINYRDFDYTGSDSTIIVLRNDFVIEASHESKYDLGEE